MNGKLILLVWLSSSICCSEWWSFVTCSNIYVTLCTGGLKVSGYCIFVFCWIALYGPKTFIVLIILLQYTRCCLCVFLIWCIIHCLRHLVVRHQAYCVLRRSVFCVGRWICIARGLGSVAGIPLHSTRRLGILLYMMRSQQSGFFTSGCALFGVLLLGKRLRLHVSAPDVQAMERI